MAGHPRSIDEYLAGLSDENRSALEKIRKAVHSAAPKAEECISYGMPVFRLDGKCIAGFRAAKDHCSYHPMSGATVAALQKELAAYDIGRGTIRFSARAPLPAALVDRLVKTRIAEIVKKPGIGQAPRGARKG